MNFHFLLTVECPFFLVRYKFRKGCWIVFSTPQNFKISLYYSMDCTVHTNKISNGNKFCRFFDLQWIKLIKFCIRRTSNWSNVSLTFLFLVPLCNQVFLVGVSFELTIIQYKSLKPKNFLISYKILGTSMIPYYLEFMKTIFERFALHLSYFFCDPMFQMLNFGRTNYKHKI